jgi:hypothetical protein
MLCVAVSWFYLDLKVQLPQKTNPREESQGCIAYDY